MKTLIISDIHLDEGKEAEYRWQIFPWLSEQITRYKIDRLIILGDLTERKDNHSSNLVNRLVRYLKDLRDLLETEIIVLKGNHDYDKLAREPFFGFLGNLHDIVHFINGQERVGMYELFLAHARNPEQDWQDLDIARIKTVYMHQCIQGARFANNYETDKGCNVGDLIPHDINIYAGDIHMPQDVGWRFTYVGAPYSVDFGDHYDGRVLITEEGEPDISIFPCFLRKWSITIRDLKELNEYELSAGDRAKVTIQLLTSEYCIWQEKRDEVIKILEANGVINKGISMETIKVKKRLRVVRDPHSPLIVKSASPEDWVKLYSQKEELAEDYVDVGLSIL